MVERKEVKEVDVLRLSKNYEVHVIFGRRGVKERGRDQRRATFGLELLAWIVFRSRSTT